MISVNELRAGVTFEEDGNLFKGEIPFEIFKMRVEGQFVGEDLSLSVNILDAKYVGSEKVVAMTTSLHRASEAGNYVATIILRSPQVATIAMRDGVLYETAALEKLTTGNNFLGAFLSCQ